MQPSKSPLCQQSRHPEQASWAERRIHAYPCAQISLHLALVTLGVVQMCRGVLRKSLGVFVELFCHGKVLRHGSMNSKMRSRLRCISAPPAAVLLAQLWSITLHMCAAAFTLFAAAPKEGRVTVQGRHELW
jgi:hypothetical protein